MRTNLIKTMGLALFIGLLMPAGTLLAKASSTTPGLTSNSSNRYDVKEASDLLNSMQDLAINARNSLGPIQVNETDLTWQDQSIRLNRARSNVNKMGDDLLQLDEMSSKLEPWQQRLIRKITPRVQEMAFQMDAAIHKLRQYHSKDHLALTQYPQNINQIYTNADQLADSVRTVTQYVHAEEKMAALNKMNRAKARS